MIENPNNNINNYERPTHILLSEMKDLHEEFAKLTLDFATICDRMENCAKRINAYGAIVSKAIFADFDRAGVRLGNFIRFTDADDPDALYRVSGIDSEGFWLQALPTGEEYQMKLLENRNRLQKIRYYNENSMRVQKLREIMLQNALVEGQAGAISDEIKNAEERPDADAEQTF